MATDTDLSRLKDDVNSESTEISNLDTVHKPLTDPPLKVTPALSWEQKIRRRLHRYASLISVLGIAIPFGTFFIKDVLRDQQKDFESLETARAELTAKQNIDALENKIDHIIKDLHSSLAQSRQQSRDEMDFEHWLDEVFFILHRTENDIASMVALSAKLPSEFSDRKKWRGFDKQAKQIESKESKFYVAYKQVATPLQRGSSGCIWTRIILVPEWQPGATQEERDQTFIYQHAQVRDGIDKEVRALKSDVEKEEAKLLKGFEEETAHIAHHLRTWTYLSWVLYPVGVLITLLGGLAGVKIPGAE
jgi:hypothetical protein